ncbi:MAG TPA: carboxypeptidase-like regulatory domain-containing protein [Chitinophagaceae bacterium]|nr:carboxypeptidase-like regulatory domain-containing protein [Chitinophagaceae bacterium]
MSKKLQLTIPKPCHENWDNMTPVQQGKFCGSCQKQVVDFSNMSDRQVAEFFKKPSTGSVCGRFMTDQLDRSIEIPKKRIPWLKYFFQFVIPAFLVSIKATSQKTQGKIKVSTTTKDTLGRPVDMPLMGIIALPVCNKPLKGDVKITPVKKPVVDKTVKVDTVLLPEVVISCNSVLRMGKVLNYQAAKVEPNVIKGKVVDEKGNAVPYTTIHMKGTTTGTLTDANGLFSFVPLNNPDVVVTLVASCISFMPAEVMINKKNYADTVIIKLERVRELFLGEVVVCRKPLTKKELKNIPLMPDIIDHTATFRVFPNPIESGNSINIEIQKMEEGYYSVQLLDQSGRSMHQQEIWIDAEARLLSIDVPAVAAGSYFLALSNKKSGKKLTEKIIIQ